MNKNKGMIVLIFLILLALIFFKLVSRPTVSKFIKLPLPIFKSNTSIEEAILKRKSQRFYKMTTVSFEALSQILWSAQGIRNLEGFRVAPSAGALYPLELYVVVRHVKDLPSGVYHYFSSSHRLEELGSRYNLQLLEQAAHGQKWVKDAPLVIIIASNTNRTKVKYGDRALRYVLIEAGHVAQNMMLQAVSLRLGIVGVGSFDEKTLIRIFNLKGMDVLYLICIGNE